MLRKWDMEVLKIISNGYFHEDYLEEIINLKFQLSTTNGYTF